MKSSLELLNSSHEALREELAELKAEQKKRLDAELSSEMPIRRGSTTAEGLPINGRRTSSTTSNNSELISELHPVFFIGSYIGTALLFFITLRWIAFSDPTPPDADRSADWVLWKNRYFNNYWAISTAFLLLNWRTRPRRNDYVARGVQAGMNFGVLVLMIVGGKDGR